MVHPFREDDIAENEDKMIKDIRKGRTFTGYTGIFEDLAIK